MLTSIFARGAGKKTRPDDARENAEMGPDKLDSSYSIPMHLSNATAVRTSTTVVRLGDPIDLIFIVVFLQTLLEYPAAKVQRSERMRRHGLSNCPGNELRFLRSAPT